MDWTNKSVLVTGAGGFIGSHLVEQLVLLGARTRGFVRYNSAGSWGWLDQSEVKKDVEVVLGDVRDRDSLERAFANVDVVFHLAALIAIPYSYEAPLSYVRTNVEGTVNVLQAALRHDVALVVHTSTSEVYGTARTIPISEEHPLQGQSPYSASKIGADKIAESFHLSFGLPVVTVRPFNTYGPRQSARAVIPTIITQALAGEPIKLGNVEPTRDLNYVKDTAAGFIKAAEHTQAAGKTFNLGAGREISIKDLALMILRLMNKEDLPLLTDDQRVRPPGSEVERLCANTEKAQAMLGWAPAVTLETGLTNTIEWIRENKERYRSSVYVV
ncbi:MAG TPA: SDR family NAD(P)-dependent oxidoreductase [Pyrinomonadaceae bacterium]|nr:SDR family NAD(P)-dependent oxidoreductase [Pyrinomonadaceae bacterium]